MNLSELMQNAPDIGLVVPPVCSLRELIAVESLLESARTDAKPIVRNIVVSHGVSTGGKLATNPAIGFQDDDTLGTFLVLKCKSRPSLEGMMTGTSNRKRVHRYFYQFADYSNGSNINLGLDHDIAHQVRYDAPKKHVEDFRDFLEIMMTLMALTEIDRYVGAEFEQNIMTYSGWLRDSGKLDNGWY